MDFMTPDGWAVHVRKRFDTATTELYIVRGNELLGAAVSNESVAAGASLEGLAEEVIRRHLRRQAVVFPPGWEVEPFTIGEEKA